MTPARRNVSSDQYAEPCAKRVATIEIGPDSSNRSILEVASWFYQGMAFIPLQLESGCMVDLLDTYIEDRNRIQPNHANNLGTAHGGIVLRWMDDVGAMSAMRLAGAPCVTAHIDSVDFDIPLELGDIALIEAYVYAAGRTSVRVRVRAHGEDPFSGDSEVTTESYFVFVAIDEDRNPIEVPELTVSTEKGERLHDQALTEE